MTKYSDKYYETRNLQTPIREGRRVTAKFEERYQAVIPVVRVGSIAFSTPRSREENRQQKKENTFDGILKKQLNQLALEENQTFQLFC